MRVNKMRQQRNLGIARMKITRTRITKMSAGRVDVDKMLRTPRLGPTKQRMMMIMRRPPVVIEHNGKHI